MNTEQKSTSIQFVTLGGSPGSALGGVQKVPTDDLVIFTSSKMKDTAKEVQEKLHNTFKIESEILEVDPFDIMDSVTKIVQKASEKIKEAEDNQTRIKLSMNMTGGTNIMASSMLLSAYIIAGFAGESEMITEARLYYIKEADPSKTEVWAKDEKLIEVPLPRISMKELTQKRRDIMIRVGEQKRIYLDALRRDLEFKSTPALKRHTDLLEQRELLGSEINKKKKMLYLTDSGQLLLSLFRFL